MADLSSLLQTQRKTLSGSGYLLTEPFSGDIDNVLVIDFNDVQDLTKLCHKGFTVYNPGKKDYVVIFGDYGEESIDVSEALDGNTVYVRVNVPDEFPNLTMSLQEAMARYVFNQISRTSQANGHGIGVSCSGSYLIFYDPTRPDNSNIDIEYTYKALPTGIVADENYNTVYVGVPINTNRIKLYTVSPDGTKTHILPNQFRIKSGTEIPSKIDKFTTTVELGHYEPDCNGNPVFVNTWDYTDTFGDVYTMSDFVGDVELEAISNIKSISGEYVGPPKTVKLNTVENSTIRAEDLKITVELFQGIEGKQNPYELLSGEFSYDPNMIKGPLTKVKVTYGNRYETAECVVDVPADFEIKQILAWYEGPDILVGRSYSPDNVIVYLINNLDQWIRVSVDKADNDDTPMAQHHTLVIYPTDQPYRVSRVGDNWFRIKFNMSGMVLSDIFNVTGIQEDVVIDKKLKIRYIRNKAKWFYLDVTEDYLPYLGMEDVVYLTWKQFLNACADFGYYGLFEVILPPNTGMNTRYPTRWFAWARNYKTIRAHCVEVYRKK